MKPQQLMQQFEVKSCRRCSLPLNECSKGRWGENVCTVNGTKWDTHVISMPDMISTIIQILKEQEAVVDSEIKYAKGREVRYLELARVKSSLQNTRKEWDLLNK